MKFLSTPLHIPGVNLTTDNWFSSSQLSANLLQKQITLLETMRKSSENFATNLQQERQEGFGQASMALVTDYCIVWT